MDWSNPIETLDGWLKWSENRLVDLATVAIFLMSLLITLGVASRIVTGKSLPGIPTFVTIYFMIGIIFLTGPYLQRVEGNVRVDLIYSKLGDVEHTLINLSHRVVMIVIFGWFAYLTFLQTQRRWISDAAIHGVITFPTAYSWAMLPAGFTLVCLRLLFQVRTDLQSLVREVSGRDGD